jgi:hypothetical protein
MSDQPINNFDNIFLLNDAGTIVAGGEAMYCECGTLCASNVHGCTVDLDEKMNEGDTLNLGDGDLRRCVNGPLPEVYIGAGFDDGEPGARENECDHCCDERDLSKVEPKLPAFFSNPFKNEPTVAPYRWKITRDHIADDDAEPGTNCNAVGMEGPANCDPKLKSNPTRFVMKDDDGTTYYQGMLYGDFDGFEPLRDFGTPNAGAVQIFINGEML